MAEEAFRFELIRTGYGDHALLRCEGRLTAGNGAERPAWTALLDSPGRADLLLDLSGVTQIDAAGLGRLVELRQVFHRRGGSLRVIEAPGRIRAMLRVTGLADLLDRPEPGCRVLPFRGRAYRANVHGVMPPTAAAV